MPQCVDLDRLADARRDDPVADLRVHPRQLHTWLADVQQPVLRIDMDPVTRALAMPVHDLLECGVEIGEERTIRCRIEIGGHGVEVPEGGVRRVVLGSLATVREAIWQHALARVRGKRAQNRCRIVGPSRCEREARQRDHGVASPVAEPGIAGDDRPALCSRRIACAGAAHDELIGGEHQLPDPRGRARRCSIEEPLAARQLALEGAGSALRRLGSRSHDQSHCVARRYFRVQHTGTEEVLQGIEPALRLRAMLEAPVPIWTGAELSAVEHHSIGLCARERRDRTTVLERSHRERPAAVRVRVIVPIGAERHEL